ncbi:MAG: Holliday junction resolvase RuvX [Holosporaceae bacterium]|nr:Holliday junction resolvase RuvX [Holosporaceae bacterium]
MKQIAEIEIDRLISSKLVVMGLDVGDKTIGVAISDEGIKIASGLTTIVRGGSMDVCCSALLHSVRHHKIGLVIFGWPLQMNGIPGKQCEKVLKFIEQLASHMNPNVNFVEWDERFSTKVVDNIMIEANLSRRKRHKSIDRGAAVYILQGAVDFLNRPIGLRSR